MPCCDKIGRGRAKRDHDGGGGRDALMDEAGPTWPQGTTETATRIIALPGTSRTLNESAPAKRAIGV